MAEYGSAGDAPGKHGKARALAEAALAAEKRGDQDEADRLFAEAQRTDPEAVADVLQSGTDTAPPKPARG